jgi:hypothetical protein
MKLRVGKMPDHRVRGSILIFTLWILVCLSLISLGFGYRVRLETKATTYTVANSGAFYIAEKALYDKIIELMGYREPEGAQSSGGAGQNSGEEQEDVRSEVLAEEGKVNVNSAPEDVIENLKPIRGTIARTILRMRLGEDSKRGTGDEMVFRLPEELLAIKEMDIDTEEWYGEKADEPGIKDLLTVYGDGRIDITSAPPEVIEAIPHVTRRLADEIVTFRAGPDGTLGTDDDRKWKSSGEMKTSLDLSRDELAPFEKYCKFGSDYYRVTVVARKGGTNATARISAVVRVGGDGFTIVSWRED